MNYKYLTTNAVNHYYIQKSICFLFFYELTGYIVTALLSNGCNHSLSLVILQTILVFFCFLYVRKGVYCEL